MFLLSPLFQHARGPLVAAAAVLLAATVRPAGAAEIIEIPQNNANLNAFAYVGTVEPGDDLKLLRHLSGLTKRRFTTVYLYSEGGDLGTGLEIGRILRDQKIRAVVQPITAEGAEFAKIVAILKERGFSPPAGLAIEDYLILLKPGLCASACALAFLGGTDSITGRPWRTKAASARLGFHSFSRSFKPGTYSADDMSRETQIAQRIAFNVISYMQDIDLSLRFVPIMFKVESASMNFISNREALLLGIHVWDDQLPKDSGFIPSDRVETAGGTVPPRCPTEPQQ
ncbi:MAG: hypothetical protein F9K44_02865 [Hyphomicrobiaceae bacterium]|nr:MAG: hypothetical protein F9K44_02865 [Hyphomicrobiaceae bacterium]